MKLETLAQNKVISLQGARWHLWVKNKFNDAREVCGEFITCRYFGVRRRATSRSVSHRITLRLTAPRRNLLQRAVNYFICIQSRAYKPNYTGAALTLMQECCTV
ncbi:unnamed protein product [Euphydryas editha]|uniref:Uncharacterized protein n=1 Tax=Euphydryas editha TaxID=104508 RepID=A0AAU9V7W5_EUPED|nr:unnamed protein product [Euphydryas editha]